MKMKIVLKGTVLIMAAAVILTAAPAYAEYEGTGNQERTQKRQEAFENLVDELGLGKEQVDQLKAHRAKKREVNKELFMALKDERKKLKEELEKPESDKRAIKAIAKNIKKMQADLVDKKIDSVLEVKSILTPEQFIQFKEKLEKVHRRKKDRKCDGESGGMRKSHEGARY